MLASLISAASQPRPIYFTKCHLATITQEMHTCHQQGYGSHEIKYQHAHQTYHGESLHENAGYRSRVCFPSETPVHILERQ